MKSEATFIPINPNTVVVVSYDTCIHKAVEAQKLADDLATKIGMKVAVLPPGFEVVVVAEAQLR